MLNPDNLICFAALNAALRTKPLARQHFHPLTHKK